MTNNEKLRGDQLRHQRRMMLMREQGKINRAQSRADLMLGLSVALGTFAFLMMMVF